MISIPFSGSKKYSYKNVKAIAQAKKYKRVFEPFGGSCVLSVNLLNDGLVDEAIVNDYDHFFDLYPQYLDLKDKVVAEGYKRGLKRTSHSTQKGYYCHNADGSTSPVKSRILQGKERVIIQDIISKNVPEEFWKYFALGGNFVFSARSSHKDIKLSDFTLFSAYLKTDKQRKYLEVLKRCKIDNLDWRDFISKYEITPDDLVILDPPYIGVMQEQYNGQFNIYDTVDLLKRVTALGCDFIFFNHDINLVKELTKDLDTTIEYTGCSATTNNHKRKDVLAFVKNSGTEKGAFFSSQDDKYPF